MLRVLRGCVLAGTSASLSIAAHAAAGGSNPPLGTTAVITLLLAAAGIGLADRQRGTWSILGALGASQLALHVILEVMSGHSMHGDQHMDMGSMRHMEPTLPLNEPTMTLGHIAVVLLTGLAMAHAERAIFAVARLVRAILPRRAGPLPVLTPPPTICVPAPIARTLAQLIFQRIHGRRGPPKSLFGNILG